VSKVIINAPKPKNSRNLDLAISVIKHYMLVYNNGLYYWNGLYYEIILSINKLNSMLIEYCKGIGIILSYSLLCNIRKEILWDIRLGGRNYGL